MPKTFKALNKQYDSICNEIVDMFARKHSLDFDGWVSDEVGGIAVFSTQYFFSMSDIIFDLQTKQKKWFILEWQTVGAEYHSRTGSDKSINYRSYAMGMRYEDLDK